MKNVVTVLAEKYKKAANRLLLLDYDGTLVNYAVLPGLATPSEQLQNILQRLNQMKQTKVIIITGRGHEGIDKLIGHLPVDIIAEHGAMRKKNNAWEKNISDIGAWKNELLPVFEKFTVNCPGSFIEEKHFSVTWHYRNADAAAGYTQSRGLIKVLEKYVQQYNLKILDGNKVVEILSASTGKGLAAGKITEQNHYDYILSIGDDKTDEEMFEALADNNNAFTVKVGEGETFAKYKLHNVADVMILLELLLE